MCPELCARRFVTSPVTQTWPTCFSSSRRICSVSSLTDNTRRICSVGNSSPKSHWDLVCLLIKIPIQLSHEMKTDETRKSKSAAEKQTLPNEIQALSFVCHCFDVGEKELENIYRMKLKRARSDE